MVAATEQQAPTLKAILPPRGQQLAFIKSGAYFKWARTGQGGGKTVAGVFECRRYAKRWPNCIVIATEPTYPMVRDILKVEFDRQFAAAGETYDYNHEAHRYILANGSEIWLRAGMEYDRLRGPTIAMAWMDEAEDQPYEAFRILCGRLRQPHYPHVFMFTGTPRGRSWLYWVMTAGDRPDGVPPYLGDILRSELGDEPWTEPEIFHWSSLDNPYLDPVTKALLKAAYVPGTLAYQQEVEGDVVVPEGLIYPFEFQKHVADPNEDIKFVRSSGGVDWGWTNPGVMLVGSLDTTGDIWIRDELYEIQKSVSSWWSSQGLLLEEMYGVDRWACDPSQPEHIEDLRLAGLDAVKGNNSMLPGITACATRFMNCTIHIGSKCRNLQRELGLWSWKKTPAGLMRPDEPEDANNHACDAMRYLVMELIEPGFEYGMV